MKSFLLCGLGVANALQRGDVYASVFANAPQDLQERESMEKAFKEVYGHFLENFDVEAYKGQLDLAQEGAKSFLQSRAATAYTTQSQPHCDLGVAPNVPAVRGVAAFPGGITQRAFGFDLAKLLDQLASKANGPAASNVFAGILAAQGLAMGAGMIQSVMHAVLEVVPPLIPPPVWINQPLPCMPMVTGHNCFGAVLYPITAADFATADVTDAQLDGTMAGFPALYRQKVGVTSDAAYKLCASAYFSMQCASIFPRCAVPMSREQPAPVGKLPMCFTSCVASLVACPGLWLTDIMEECSLVSAPPACTIAVWSNFARLPPQYVSYEDANPTPVECPTAPASLSIVEGSATDFDLYSSDMGATSPYTGASSVPSA